MNRQGLRLIAAGVAFSVALATLPSARAQIRLPPLPAPQIPGVVRPAIDTLTATTGSVLADVRALKIRELLKRDPAQLDTDRAGNLIVRGEVTAFAPSDGAIEIAAGLGLVVERRAPLEGLDAELLVFRVPRGNSVHRALAALRKADPGGIYDYNHIYLSVGSVIERASAPTPRTDSAAPAAGASGAIGLIDGGVDRAHSAFRHTAVEGWGCDPAVPDVHGTEVASLLVGDDESFHGAAPHSRLYAADVYCGGSTGGAVDAVARAFGWLVARGVAVINVSLVGPRNATLAAVVARALAHGQIIVAAVGNDGPAAPPLYPAAYPGVIGVTGVDAKRRVLLEANRGPQVAFAAPGDGMLAATLGDRYAEVRGTSFATPIVAGLLAAICLSPDAGCRQHAIESLASEAVDLGAHGRDPVYGYGLVGESLRIPPKK
jgi:subtilisin family serine protease